MVLKGIFFHLCLKIRAKYMRIKLDLFLVQVSFDSLKPYFWAVICRVPLEGVLMCLLSG